MPATGKSEQSEQQPCARGWVHTSFPRSKFLYILTKPFGNPRIQQGPLALPRRRSAKSSRKKLSRDKKTQNNQISRAATDAFIHGIMLSVLCVISYWLITQMLARAVSVSGDEHLLGGMWAVVATIFVYRYGDDQTIAAALSRMAATSLGFVLFLPYLLFFPFGVWEMATLIGIGALVMVWLSRPDDVIATGITTAVVMVVAAISAGHTWKQPILRVVDTSVGVAVRIIGAGFSSTFATTFASKLEPI